MEFSTLEDLLDANFIRECVLYKDPILMQKTVQYINSNLSTININSQSFNNINQLIFINKNNSLYLYLISNLFNNNQNIKEFEIININTLTIGAG